MSKLTAIFAPYMFWVRLVAGIALAAALWYALHKAYAYTRDYFQAPVKEQLQQAQTNLGTCQGNTATLQSSLDAQNKAIETLALNAKLQADALQKAQAQAKTLIAKGKADALAIEQLKLTGNCEQDMNTLAGVIK